MSLSQAHFNGMMEMKTWNAKEERVTVGGTDTW